MVGRAEIGHWKARGSLPHKQTLWPPTVSRVGPWNAFLPIPWENLISMDNKNGNKKETETKKQKKIINIQLEVAQNYY